MDDRATALRGVAEVLLEEKHLLTALEFLQELRETGAGYSKSAAELLESFFNDATRFPTEQLQPSSAFPESQDAADAGIVAGREGHRETGPQVATGGGVSGSMAVGQLEERLEELHLRASNAEKQLHAVTQELQREKQRNKVLQQQSLASSPQQSQPGPGSKDQSTERGSDLGLRGTSRRGSDGDRFVEKPQVLGPLEALEQEEINWAVREYLAEAGYKLTAITFCDEEVEQDWTSAPESQSCAVALDAEQCPRGPLLRRLYFQARHLDAFKGFSTDKLESEMAEAMGAAAAAQAEAASARAQAAASNDSLAAAQTELASAQAALSTSQAELATGGAELAAAKAEVLRLETACAEERSEREAARKQLEASRKQLEGALEDLQRASARHAKEAEASQSQISELEAQARALSESCADLTKRMEGESALASARYTRVRELEEELLRQMQATEAAQRAAEEKEVENRRLVASASSEKPSGKGAGAEGGAAGVAGGSSGLAGGPVAALDFPDIPSLTVRTSAPRSPRGGSARLTPPRSPQSISQSHSLSQPRATPPRSPKSPQGRALAELARRQLADMTMQVAELKEMLEEERARANMLATQAAAQVESARGTPTLAPLLGLQEESTSSAAAGTALPETSGPPSAGPAAPTGDSATAGNTERGVGLAGRLLTEAGDGVAASLEGIGGEAGPGSVDEAEAAQAAVSAQEGRASLQSNGFAEQGPSQSPSPGPLQKDAVGEVQQEPGVVPSQQSQTQAQAQTQGQADANGAPLQAPGQVSKEGRVDGGAREGLSPGELRAVRLIAESLPKISPNVLINHRAELLPLILYAIERHPEREARRALIHGLFNLIKKPDEEQRAAIVGACVDLIGRLGGAAFEEEVLSHGWDELVHRNEEKRLLISQLCPGIAPHVPKSTRDGLLLSLMLGAAEDPAALVREAAAMHLAHLLPALDDLSVYPKIERVVFQLVCDSDGVVVDEALQTLVPAFVTWSISRKHPFGKVLRAVMQRMRAEVDKCPPLVPPTAANAKRAEGHMRSLGEREKWNFGVLLRMLTGLLGEVRHVAYRTCPEALKLPEGAESAEGAQGTGEKEAGASAGGTGGASGAGQGGDSQGGSLGGGRGSGGGSGTGEAGGEAGGVESASAQERREAASGDEDSFITDGLLKRYASAKFEWPAFDWLAVDCLPSIIALSLMVPPREDDLRFRMCSFLLEVSRVFGRFYLASIVLPTFLTAVGHSIDTSTLHPKTGQRIALLKPEGPAAERAAKICVLPLLLGGVLGSPSMKEGYLKRYLKEWVLATCQKGGAWSVASTPELIDSVRFLCNKFGEHRDTMCTVLWDLVVNTSPAVRSTAAVLFGVLAEMSEPKKVNQQILPALVTLGADPQADVKLATIEAFGKILRQFKDEAVVGKVKEQMDLFLEDGSHEASVAVLKALVPAVPVTTNSIREYLLQKVYTMAMNPQASAANISTRLDKTDAMCLAIRALEHTEMSSLAMTNLFLPTVQALLRDSDALEPGNKEALEAILKDRGPLNFGSFGKAMGKTLGILSSPGGQHPQQAKGSGGGGGGGFSSFAAAFGGQHGQGQEGSSHSASSSTWGLDSFATSLEDRYGQRGARTKLFK